MKNAGLTKRLPALAMVVFSALFVQGAGMSPERARQRSVEWAQRAFPSRQVLHRKMRTFSGAKNKGAFHIIPFKDGGFMVSHSDDAAAPVAAFSLKGKFPEDPNHPLCRILAADAAAFAEYGDKGGTSALASPARLMAAGYPTSAFEVWVKPILKTEWAQTTHDNTKQVGFGGTGILCYNYYTPNWDTIVQPSNQGRADRGDEDVLSSHYPCGCMATAGAQVMKHFTYPKLLPDLDRSGDGGGTEVEDYTSKEYQWEKMEIKPKNGIDKDGCKAIGRICRDIGIACNARYGATTTMNSWSLANAFTGSFSYKSAQCVSLGTDADKRQDAVLPNLIYGKPVIMGIGKSTATTGHCVVADGLGSGVSASGLRTTYYHVNFGWANKVNGEVTDTWYAPPNLREYSSIDNAIVNIDKAYARAYVAGRVKSCNGGTAINGVQVQIRKGTTLIGTTLTDANGLFSFAVDSGTYEVEIFKSADGSSRKSVTVSSSSVVNDYSEYLLDLPAVAMPEIAVSWDDAGTAWITMSCATSDAKIYYTINDAKPDVASNLYAKKFPVSGAGSVSVTAVAYADGYAVSPACMRTIQFSPTTNNGTLANARVLAGLSGEIEMSNQAATRESGEPVHSPVGKDGGASVWALFTTAETGDYTFSASGRSDDGEDEDQLDTQLAVYTGNSLGTLKLVAANDDANAAEYDLSSRVAFRATAGTTYRIAIDTRFGATGTVKLEWKPGRDDVAEPEEFEALAAPSAASFSVPVHSTANWSVINSSPWITLDKASGANGESVGFSVSALPAGEKARSGIVMLRAGDDGAAASIIVSQATVEWVRSRADALSAAAESGKRILMICGRDTCSNTSHLRNTVCEDAEVRPLLASNFVLWYCNCDNDYDDYRYYAGGLGGYSLPLVCVINPETADEYVERSTGFMDKAAFLAFLGRASEGQAPSRPYGLEASITADGVALTWNASRRVSSYEVWCGDALVETTAGCSFTDSTLQSGSLCTYRVRAVNATGKSAFSDSVRVGWNEAADEASTLLGRALGAPHVVWQSGGVFPWVVQTDYATDGSAVQSGSSEPNEAVASELSAEVNGPCYMSFRYRTRMYSSTFRVVLDGDKVFEDVQGSSDWTRSEIRIPFGRHTVTFFYQKGGYYTSGFNGVYLDDVIFAEDRQVPPTPDEPIVEVPVTPGVWTRDIDGAKKAGIENGSLIVVVLANYAGCSYSQAFHSVAWSEDFLNWAKANGVYLIDADVSKNDAAYTGFWSLWNATSASFPALAITTAWDSTTPVGNAVARQGTAMGAVTYDGTAQSLENYLLSLKQTRPQSRTVTLTFYDYGNTYRQEKVTATSGQSFGSILEQKSKTGFSFDGWWTASSGGTKVMPSSIVPYVDTTFYARYHNNYTVGFDANGGGGKSMSTLPLTGGTAAKLPSCTFSRDGFVFDGWAVRPSGTTIYEDGARVVDLTSSGNGNVTLYAVWRPVANDGDWVTVSSPVNVPYGWLRKYSLLVRVDAETAANAKTGKRDGGGREMSVWEDYVAGTDPTDKNDIFHITEVRLENGEVKLSWSPDLNENGTKTERLYIQKGRRSLDGSEGWVDMKTVPDDEKNKYRFIKVVIEMP